MELTELDKFPIEALVALVNRETSELNEHVARYGEHMYDPRTSAFIELHKRFEKAYNATSNS
ncbi:hypothetical protein LCGC14_1247240 [marine sediment metagenome]|uniref:Uncharacterized protein n=1 Tax=marine sediment metagenome TaxID=412755 RepID=A0A0F9L7U8_9ZZZZ